jgi:hypothetical protein
MDSAARRLVAGADLRISILDLRSHFAAAKKLDNVSLRAAAGDEAISRWREILEMTNLKSEIDNRQWGSDASPRP